MEALLKSVSEEVIETVNKLFNYTDDRNWSGLLNEVFLERVWFDMSSLGGGEPEELEASAICKAWEQGLRDIDAVHHQAGNYIVKLNNDLADVSCYAIAIHYKNGAIKGKTREFVGSYEISLKMEEGQWRISSFQFNVKFINGNLQLE